ncbi:hypothetical protein FACS189443_4420 [Planctomycetales bacterium]|nr:hypothetical protein FACS189443_4420 [Planctomycetales bacterium]
MPPKNISQLLNGFYYPVTKTYGFLLAPLEKVVVEYWRWTCNDPYFKNPEDYYLKPQFMECSLRAGLDMLDPIGYPQILFYKTCSDWTAFLSQMVN